MTVAEKKEKTELELLIKEAKDLYAKLDNPNDKMKIWIENIQLHSKKTITIGIERMQKHVSKKQTDREPDPVKEPEKKLEPKKVDPVENIEDDPFFDEYEQEVTK